MVRAHPDKGEVGGSSPLRPTKFAPQIEEVLTTCYGAIAQLGERLLARRRSAVRSRIAPPSL